jgi:hypothetical protein
MRPGVPSEVAMRARDCPDSGDVGDARVGYTASRKSAATRWGGLVRDGLIQSAQALGFALA